MCRCLYGNGKIDKNWAMTLKQNDVRELYNEFQNENNQTDIYSSFDYCYNYFHPNSGNPLLKDIEKSCLAIGFYLSSCGMLRASAHLLTKSVKCYEPLIKHIATSKKSNWYLDVNDYESPTVKKKILDLYNGIYNVLKDEVFVNVNQIEPIANKKLRTPTLTLVTKIMLGVFGIIPAFDANFITAFKSLDNLKHRFSPLSDEPLDLIYEFYIDNKPEIDKLSDLTHTIDFKNGKKTELKYTKAKIIDMYGFIKGDHIRKVEQAKKRVGKLVKSN